MFAIITSLLGLADPLSRIADARIASIHASTDKERIEQEERVKALEARRDVLKAESDSRVNGVIRALLAAWKVPIWDKVLTLGTTDDLFENLWYVTMMVLGFYYVHWTVGRLRR